LAEIRSEYLNCIAYIYPNAQSEEDGHGGGTAFHIVARLPLEGWAQAYFVTAAHLVSSEQSNPVIRVNLLDGGATVIQTTYEGWFVDSASDIAVHPVEIDYSRVQLTVVPVEGFLTKQHIIEHRFGPGNDVFVLGRLAGHDGTKRLLPSVRFGSISMMPSEPFARSLASRVDEAFLVEFRSIGGYSGSPAFIHEVPFHLRDKAAHIHKWSYGPHLLGVDVGHIRKKEPLLSKRIINNRESYSPVPDRFYETNTAVAAIVPAWKIVELLDREDVKSARESDPAYVAATNSQ
jgi:hypothetical protein